MTGCVDWRWRAPPRRARAAPGEAPRPSPRNRRFFPCHYCPMLADVDDVAGALAAVDFRIGGPLRPLEQLMACLPPASASLLPRPHRALMVEASSPIADLYPRDFDVDMDGKRNPWEGVNLLPLSRRRRPGGPGGRGSGVVRNRRGRGAAGGGGVEGALPKRSVPQHRRGAARRRGRGRVPRRRARGGRGAARGVRPEPRPHRGP